MFETLFVDGPRLARYRAAPLLHERIRYLEHCRDAGFSSFVLKQLAANQLRLVGLLDLRGPQKVTSAQIETAATLWSRPGLLYQFFPGETRRTAIKTQFVHHSHEWLRFLGWLDEPIELPRHPHGAEVEAFAQWARAERGYSEATIEAYCEVAHDFLAFLAAAEPAIPLSSVRITDVDRAIAAKSAPRSLSRRTLQNYVTWLRNFIRFSEDRRLCMRGIADAIKVPRIYTNENLPPRLARDDVLRLLATTEGDRPADIRDRAILLLLIVYGLRSGEVRRLRLDDLDWNAETLRVKRSKSSQTHRYPLSPSVAHAIFRYIREVRPSRPDRFLFYTTRPPFRALTRSALGCVVRNRWRRLGFVGRSRGPHALRHAAAQHLLDQGMSFKVIGDFLGHANTSSTSIYAKVDLNSLREVADFDLEGLA